MARLLEFQGKDLFRRFGISPPAGEVVQSVDESLEVAHRLGYPVIVKAQVYTGKRAKAGGVRVALCEEELIEAAGELLSSVIGGFSVEKLLIEQNIEFKQEMYVGVTSDPSTRKPAAIFCINGGVDIEETAQTRPESILKLTIDIMRGIYVYDALNFLSSSTLFASCRFTVHARTG